MLWIVSSLLKINKTKWLKIPNLSYSEPCQATKYIHQTSPTLHILGCQSNRTRMDGIKEMDHSIRPNTPGMAQRVPQTPRRIPQTPGPRRAPSTADRIMSQRMMSGLVGPTPPAPGGVRNIPQTPGTNQPRAPYHLPPMTAAQHRLHDQPFPLPVQSQPFLKPQAPLSYHPSNMTCPYCGRSIHTKTVSEDSCMAVCLSATLCILGCWCCVCLPFCLESLQKVEHSCPKCKMLIGTYNAGLWGIINLIDFVRTK